MNQPIPLWAVLALLAAVATGLLAGLSLFLALQAQARKQAAAVEELNRQVLQEREDSATRLAELESRLLSSEQRAAVLVPPTPPKSGLNLTKRAQVLRLSRQGERAAGIAAALQLPRAEVELLLKVEQLGERRTA